MKKFFSTLVLIVIVVLAVLLIGKNVIAKGAIEGGVKMATGLSLQMKSLDINLMNTFIGIEGLRLQNPAGFEEKNMVDLPEIYVDYDLPAILKNDIHLPEVRLNLNEFVVVKNAQGELNLDALKGVDSGTQKEEAKPAPKEEAEMPEIRLDLLKLKIGRVVYKDYSKGAKPEVKEFNLNLDEEYQDITDPNQLVRLIVLRVMMNTPLAALTNFNVGALQSSVTETLDASKQKALEAAKQAEDLAKGMGGELEGKAKDLTGGLKDTAGALKDKVKLPFGNK